MMLNRRTFIGSTAAAFLFATKGHTMEEIDPAQVYAIIGQMLSAPGKRDELIGYLTEGSANMPATFPMRYGGTRRTKTQSGSPKSGKTKPRTRPASACLKCRKPSAKHDRLSPALAQGPRLNRQGAGIDNPVLPANMNDRTPLDRPVWYALGGPQSHLAVPHANLLRLRPDYGPFAAAAPDDLACLASLLLLDTDELWLVEPEAVAPPAGTRLIRSAPLVQMIADGPITPFLDPQIVQLSEGDVPEMTSLALATQPGPGRHKHGSLASSMVCA